MATQAEANAAALAAGITQDQINPSILAFYGYAPPNPTAGIIVGPVIASADVAAAFAALSAEAKANSLPSAIMGELTTILGWAKSAGLLTFLTLAICAGLVLCTGCSTTAAQNAEKQRSQIEQGLNQQHLAFEEGVIQYYISNETGRINHLYNAALVSATVNGNIPVNIATALANQRTTLLATMAANVATMRTQQGQIVLNAAVLSQYSDAMMAYFQNSAADMASVQASANTLLQFIEQYLVPTASPTTANPPVMLEQAPVMKIEPVKPTLFKSITK